MSIFRKDKTDQGGQSAPATAMPAAKNRASGNKQNKPGKIAVDKRNKSLKTISVTSTIIFLMILLVVNIAFDSLLGDTLKWDWTPGQKYSIGDVSHQILDSMTKDVQIIGLFDDQTDQKYIDIQEMLRNYVKASKGRISVRYVDPVKFPSILTEIDPNGYMNPDQGTFVVYCPDTKKAKNLKESDIFQYEFDQQTFQQYLTGVTAEQSISGAIKYVQSVETPVVYFTSGHGELDYQSRYSFIMSILSYNNYDVKQIDLLGVQQIPDDCTTLIIAAPSKDISTGESRLITDYLQHGGGLMVIAGYTNVSFPVLNEVLLDYNIEISDDKIREGDINHRFNNDPYTIRAIAPSGTITPTTVDAFTLVDNVRGINQLQNSKEWITVAPVLTTSAEGVAETGGDSTQSSVPGTKNIGLICENYGYVDQRTVTESAKVMVIGSSGIFDDSTIQISQLLYNPYIFYYGLRWLANDTSDNLYIAAKTPISYSITTGTESLRVLTAVFVMLIIPGALLLAAFFVYRKRKHL